MGRVALIIRAGVSGQGAGVAVALSIKAGTALDAVDMTAVQAEVKRQGVRID